MVNKHVFNESRMCDFIHYITISKFPGVVGGRGDTAKAFRSSSCLRLETSFHDYELTLWKKKTYGTTHVGLAWNLN